MENIKRISLIILSIMAIYGVWSVATSAYFSDVGSIIDNSIAMSTWMSIDSGSAILAGNGYTLLHSILLIPDEDGDTIDKIAVSWTDDNGENINEIRIGGEIFWSGNAKSGDILDGDDYILDKRENNKYRFSSDMHDKAIMIEFYMDNGQIITDIFTPKWRDDI